MMPAWHPHQGSRDTPKLRIRVKFREGRQKSGAFVEQPALAVSVSRCHSNFEGSLMPRLRAGGEAPVHRDPIWQKEPRGRVNSGRGFKSSGLAILADDSEILL